MRKRIAGLGIVCAVTLFGQSYGHWQDSCFKNPGLPYCPGHDFAVKPTPPAAAPRTVTNNPFPSTQRGGAPSMIVMGGIDWRFADPFADALIGFNFGRLAASPIARTMLAQLGTKQGLREADMQKIFDGLSGVDEVAVSLHNNQAVVMITGSVTDSSLQPPGAGLKTVALPSGAILVGHADAVDWAARRIAMKVAPGELARLAEERQAGNEFWAIGSPSFVGPQAASAGVKRFSLTVSMRDRFFSDIAFEFNGMPNPNTVRQWQTTLGPAVLEGNTMHLRTALEAKEIQQKFAQIIASPVGQRLGMLVEAARYLPVPDTNVPKQTKPVIYGLDDGPKTVN